jgi:hypothetical protein
MSYYVLVLFSCGLRRKRRQQSKARKRQTKESIMTKAPTDPHSSVDGSPPTLTIDWGLYASYLEESDLDDDQKREFIETLWSIVVSFVDLGFGIDPTQQVCGQNSNDGIFLPADVISSLDNSDNHINERDADHINDDPASQEDS